MATITEVQSDQHRYLIFDATALPVGTGIHSTVTDSDNGEVIETTIVRIDETTVHVTQSYDGEVENDDEWSFEDVAMLAASGFLSPYAIHDLISVDDAFLEEHLQPSHYEEYMEMRAQAEQN